MNIENADIGMRFKGKVAVVTGAGSGLGRASAHRLSSEGASVVVVDINDETAQKTAAELPGEALAVAADVSSEEDVQNYMKSAIEHFGRVDLVHLNAGIFGSFDLLPEVSVDDFERVQAVNVRGQFLGIRETFRHFENTGSTGNIVVTASIASITAGHDLLPYHVSKHAVVGLVRSAAIYGGPLGIRVNAVAPGIVPTDLFAGVANSGGGKKDMENRASTTPLRRAGNPEEIAGTVAFLLSADSGYITGQTLSADGGAAVANPVRAAGGAGAWDTATLDATAYGEKVDSSAPFPGGTQ